ncbi:MAG: hypothetical protein V3V93_04060 [bacterium]
MSPTITEVLVESKKTLKLPTGTYVSESCSLRVGFENGELPLNDIPEDVNAPAYIRGLHRMAEAQVAEALEPYLGDGDFRTREGRAPGEPPEEPERLTENQEKAIWAKRNALKKLGEEGTSEAIINTHLKSADMKDVPGLTKEQASNLLDTLQREIEKHKESE